MEVKEVCVDVVVVINVVASMAWVAYGRRGVACASQLERRCATLPCSRGILLRRVGTYVRICLYDVLVIMIV